MSDTRRLAESYVETFRDAVEAINDFGRGGRERSILYEGRPVRIGYVIGVASHYRDVMPPDLHRRLCEVALPGEEPEDITFAAGARALRARYNDIMKQRRTNAEAQVPGRWVPLRPHRPEP
jgi:hypothetical protein